MEVEQLQALVDGYLSDCQRNGVSGEQDEAVVAALAEIKAMKTPITAETLRGDRWREINHRAFGKGELRVYTHFSGMHTVFVGKHKFIRVENAHDIRRLVKMVGGLE